MNVGCPKFVLIDLLFTLRRFHTFESPFSFHSAENILPVMTIEPRVILKTLQDCKLRHCVTYRLENFLKVVPLYSYNLQ